MDELLIETKNCMTTRCHREIAWQLYSFIGDETLSQQVVEMFTTFSKALSSYGSGHAQFLQSLLLMESPKKKLSLSEKIVMGEACLSDLLQT